MATSSSSPPCARFDRFQVDLSIGELRRSGNPVPIQEQPLQVLRLLLEAGCNVVTREQLRAALWPEDSFVDFEHGVNTAVRKLRTALDDSAEHPRFIETLPKVGYRFIVQVEWVTDNNGRNGLRRFEPVPPTPPPTPPKLRWKLKAAAVIVTLAAIASLVSLSDPNSRLAQSQLGSSLRRILVHQPPEVIERQLTANPEGMPVTSAVISPDGKYLAFTDSTGFYLRQVDGGETHAVPLPKGFSPIAQSWLPDSLHLIVMWLENPAAPPSLWEISVLGGTPQKLNNGGTSARVSPDGSKVAFLREKRTDQAIWFENTDQEIWLMKIDGSEVRRIVDAGGFLGPAAWAPDGTRLAYVRATRSSKLGFDEQIEIYDLTNGHTQVILQNPALLLEIAWKNDECLLYQLEEPVPNQRRFDLWSVKLDSKAAHSIGSPTKITSDARLIDRISLTGDGKHMVLLRSSEQADAYIADLDAQGRKVTRSRRLTFDERDDAPFSWTADSKAVFFVSNRDGPVHIFRQDINETQPELVVGGSGSFLPRLSPDGSELIYAVIPDRNDPRSKSRVMRVPTTGGASELVLEEEPTLVNLECARLPSTVCVYEKVDARQHSVFTFDTRKGKGMKVLATGAPVDNLAIGSCLSPNGKYLARAREGIQKDQIEIRIFSLADGTSRYLKLPGWADTRGLDWAADSKSMWIGANRLWSGWAGTHKDRWTLLNVDLNGKVTVTPEDDVFTGFAIPSPDGRHLALWGAARSANAWLLENF